MGRRFCGTLTAESDLTGKHWRLHGYEGRRFVACFWFVGWDCLSLGLHVCLGAPNIEVHVPFGFFKIGCKRPPIRVEWDGDDLIEVGR